MSLSYQVKIFMLTVLEQYDEKLYNSSKSEYKKDISEIKFPWKEAKSL